MRSRPEQVTIAAVVVLLVARMWLAIVLWEPGWSALTWDDFSRVEQAQAWAADPRFAPDLLWLPLPYWVYGSAFGMVGERFPDNPMLLVALLNTGLMVMTAAVCGWSARRLFGSRLGGLVAFAAMLFAPWGVWLSLSGLAEPLYCLAVAGAVAATIRWLQDGSRSWLALAAGSIAASAACRYEGWALAAAWMLVVAWTEWRRPDASWRAKAVNSIVIASPGLVPAAWMLINLSRAGDPLFFARTSGRIFLAAFGPLYGFVARALYYPRSLLGAAPLLLVGAGLALIAWRRDRVVVAITAVVGIGFVGLWMTSIASPAVGAFNERYLFAFAVAVAPLVGGLPAIAASAARRHRSLGVVALTIAVAVGALGVIRLAHRPVEWTVAPDLLTLVDELGAISSPEAPRTVLVGAGMENDLATLGIRNGSSIDVVIAPTSAAIDPDSIDPGVLLVERLPTRIAAIATAPQMTVGRYAVYGTEGPSTTPCPGCAGWTLRTENGVLRPIPAGPFVPLEFDGDDPDAGQEVIAWVDISRTGETRRAVLELRSLYGHGFNPERLELLVRVDDTVVFRRDLAEPSRWLAVGFPIDPGTGVVRVEVVVRALPGIETGWKWGRSSTVLIRSLVVEAS